MREARQVNAATGTWIGRRILAPNRAYRALMRVHKLALHLASALTGGDVRVSIMVY